MQNTEDFKRVVMNTIITSNVLRDNLELMNEKGYQTKRCKQIGNMYHRELDKFLESFYKAISNVPQDFLIDEIDFITELVDKVLKSSSEKRKEAMECL